MSNEPNPFETPQNLASSPTQVAHPGASRAAWVLVGVLALIASVPGFFVSCLGAIFLSDAIGDTLKLDPAVFILGGAALGGLLASVAVLLIGGRIIGAKKRQRLAGEEPREN